MKLYTKLIISLLSFPSFIFSQTLDANVFGSSGNFFLNDKSVSYTIGEVIVYPYEQQNHLLFQGFQNIASELNCHYDCVLFNQQIDLPEGWSYWSTYLSPKNSDMEEIFETINNEVIILKDQYGEVYWPYFGINGVNTHTLGEGYQIKMNSSQTLNIQGYKQINPTVTIYEDWNILGCLYYEPKLIEENFSPVIENIILVKDENANVFWPFLSINTIQYFEPGEAYAVKSNSDFNFTFQNINEENNRYFYDNSRNQTFHFQAPKFTNNNMTIGFSKNILSQIMNTGDEIAVFDKNNNIVGVEVFENQNLAITVWGDDPYTNNKDGMNDFELMKFKIWDNNSNKEYNLDIVNWEQGDNYYLSNGINIAKEVKIKNENILGISLGPNPIINSNINLNFELVKNCMVDIYLIDNLGKRKNIFQKNLEMGRHSLDFDLDLKSGFYNIIIEHCDNLNTIPVSIVSN